MAEGWTDPDPGAISGSLEYMFTIAEAGAVRFASESCVKQPDEGYAETVIARRSRQPNVTRTLPAGDWDVIVRVFDVLSSVSVAHTRINVTLAQTVTADVTREVIDEGLTSIQDADPSEGLNRIQARLHVSYAANHPPPAIFVCRPSRV